MKQEFQYSTKLWLFDNRRLSINYYYVVFAALLPKNFSWQANKIDWWQIRQWSHLVDEKSFADVNVQHKQTCRTDALTHD